MTTDNALKRIAPTLIEVCQHLRAHGADRATINAALKAALPSINYILQLDARLSALECRVRAQAENDEARG